MSSKYLIRFLVLALPDLVGTVNEAVGEIFTQFVKLVVVKDDEPLYRGVCFKKCCDFSDSMGQYGCSACDVSVQAVYAENSAQGLNSLALTP